MRNAFIDTVIGQCKARKDIFIISGDAGLGVFDGFKEESSDRFLNLGVAEQNAASFAAGLSLTGYKVYIYNIIPFVLYRCYEQVRNDICYQKLPVVLVGIGSGVTYAPQGMTHYSVEDLGIAQTLPNLTVFSPADPAEARAAALYSIKATEPVYVRLAKRGEPAIHDDNILDITSPQLIKDGKDIAMLFHGSIGEEVMRASRLMESCKIHPRLISVPMLQPINLEKLFHMLDGISHVLTIEEHFIDTGLGGIMAMEYAKRNPEWDLSSLGVPYKFVHDIKDLAGMRELFGISAKKIAEFASNLSARAGKI